MAKAKKSRSEVVKSAAAALGKLGGPARARALTGKRRHDIAVQGGKARAKKQ